MPQDMTWQAMKAAEYTRESPAPWTPRDIQSRGPLSLAEWLNKWNREVTWLGLLPRLFTFQPFALQLDFWPVLTAKFLTLITTYRMIWHQLSCLFKCTSLTRDNHTIPFCDAGSAPRVKPTMSSPQSPFQHTSARKLPSWSQTSKKKKKKVTPWRREWQPTPVFSPGKSHVQNSLEGYSPWVGKRVGHDLVTKQWQQCSNNRTLAGLRKEWNSDTYYNIDEPWKHQAKWKKNQIYDSI